MAFVEVAVVVADVDRNVSVRLDSVSVAGAAARARRSEERTFSASGSAERKDTCHGV